MTLREWLSVRHPGRGGHVWLMRNSGASFPTIRKALDGEPLSRISAEKISAATRGEVPVSALVAPESVALAHADTLPPTA